MFGKSANGSLNGDWSEKTREALKSLHALFRKDEKEVKDGDIAKIIKTIPEGDERRMLPGAIKVVFEGVQNSTNEEGKLTFDQWLKYEKFLESLKVEKGVMGWLSKVEQQQEQIIGSIPAYVKRKPLEGYEFTNISEEPAGADIGYGGARAAGAVWQVSDEVVDAKFGEVSGVLLNGKDAKKEAVDILRELQKETRDKVLQKVLDNRIISPEDVGEIKRAFIDVSKEVASFVGEFYSEAGADVVGHLSRLEEEKRDVFSDIIIEMGLIKKENKTELLKQSAIRSTEFAQGGNAAGIFVKEKDRGFVWVDADRIGSVPDNTPSVPSKSDRADIFDDEYFNIYLTKANWLHAYFTNTRNGEFDGGCIATIFELVDDKVRLLECVQKRVKDEPLKGGAESFEMFGAIVESVGGINKWFESVKSQSQVGLQNPYWKALNAVLDIFEKADDKTASDKHIATAIKIIPEGLREGFSEYIKKQIKEKTNSEEMNFQTLEQFNILFAQFESAGGIDKWLESVEKPGYKEGAVSRLTRPRAMTI